MYYYRARYYSPQLGRFISEDPAGIDAGTNIYSYVRGDAMDRRDPLGLFDLSEAMVGFGDAFLIPIVVRNLMGISTSFDNCSPSYKAGNLEGVLWGLGVPYSRAAYAFEVSRIPTISTTAEEAVGMRNALKAYYRGWPLNWMIQDYRTVDGLRLVKADAQIVERAGVSSAAWDAGLIYGGVVKSAIGLMRVRCDCR
jgi:hypothetical protein